MNRSIAGCMTVAIIVAAGCGKTREPMGDAATGTAAAATTATSAASDACTVLAVSDVNAAFAPRVFVLDNSGPTAPKQSAKFAQISNCTFVSKGASVREMVVVTVMLRRAPSDETGTTIKGMKEGAVKLGGTPVDVAGLGDSAYWINLGGSTRPNRQLNVVKGKRIWLMVGEGGSKLSDAEAIASLTKVAQTALGRI